MSDNFTDYQVIVDEYGVDFDMYFGEDMFALEYEDGLLDYFDPTFEVKE